MKNVYECVKLLEKQNEVKVVKGAAYMVRWVRVNTSVTLREEQTEVKVASGAPYIMRCVLVNVSVNL